MSAEERPLTMVSLLTKLSVVPGRNFAGQMIVGDVGADVMIFLMLIMPQRYVGIGVDVLVRTVKEKDDDDMRGNGQLQQTQSSACLSRHIIVKTSNLLD